MRTLDSVLLFFLFSAVAPPAALTGDPVSIPPGEYLPGVLPVELTLALRSQHDGSVERRGSVSSGARTLLFRDRMQPDAERQRVIGYESPTISVGPLRPSGYLRSIEAPLSASPVAGAGSDAGGYRLKREGGYGATPGFALRLPFAGAYHRDTDTFVLTGLNVLTRVRLLTGVRLLTEVSANSLPGTDRTGGSYSPGDGGRSNTAAYGRLFLARSAPLTESEPSEWLPERQSRSPGPLWFSGVELSAGPLRSELVAVAGSRVSPGWLSGVYLKRQIGRAEIRGSIQGRSSRFVGADGRRPEERARAGLRYERVRGALFRPLLGGDYYLSGLAGLPDSYRGDGWAGTVGAALGPVRAFVRPRLDARYERDSAGGERTRLTARLDGAVGGEAARIDAGVRRSSDSAEKGAMTVSAGTRVSGFVGRTAQLYTVEGKPRRAVAGLGRPDTSLDHDQSAIWQLRSSAGVRAVGYDRGTGAELLDYPDSDEWEVRLRGNVEVQRDDFKVTFVLLADEIPWQESGSRALRSAATSKLEGELRVLWNARLGGSRK